MASTFENLERCSHFAGHLVEDDGEDSEVAEGDEDAAEEPDGLAADARAHSARIGQSRTDPGLGLGFQTKVLRTC